MTRACLFLALLASLLLAPVRAGAQGMQGEARTLFDAGVEAYKQGHFMAAAQAFIKAHTLLPKPELLFSIAQAFRREFDANQDKTALAMAVKYYRSYLDEVKAGGRRLEAAQALGDLRPLLEGDEGTGEMVFPTRLSVNSPAPGAIAMLDGGAPHALPWNTQIEPGRHELVVRASGYRDARQTFDAKKGDILPFNVPLQGIAPTLQIQGADGAEVEVDGKLIGTAPFSQPLALPPGRHFVAVTERGHKAYGDELDFDYGAATMLTLELPATNQRRWAWGVMAAGGAAVATGGVLAALALAEENNAKDILALQQQGVITEQQRLAHNGAIETRDDLVTAAAVTAGVGAGVLIAGVFLFFFDEPEVAPPASRPDDADAPGDDAPPSDMDMVGAPLLGPGIYGLGLSGRF